MRRFKTRPTDNNNNKKKTASRPVLCYIPKTQTFTNESLSQ